MAEVKENSFCQEKVSERMKYQELAGKPDIAEIQANILKFWKDESVFEKSVNKENAEEVVFYDGPPFANGTPHYGHIMVSYVKDVVARFQTITKQWTFLLWKA